MYFPAECDKYYYSRGIQKTGTALEEVHKLKKILFWKKFYPKKYCVGLHFWYPRTVCVSVYVCLGICGPVRVSVFVWACECKCISMAGVKYQKTL